MHGCGASASGLIESIFFIPQRRLERGKEREDTEKESETGGLVVIELINLMALVAHLTSHSLTVLPLKSTGNK